MEKDDTIDFKTDLDQFVLYKKVDDYNVIEYNNDKIIEKYLDWYIFYRSINNSKNFRINILFIKILYCLLTNSVRVIGENFDCYNLDLNKKITIKRIMGECQKIKINKESFDILIIFDCQDMKNYKMYQYNDKFDEKNIIYTGNIENIKNDFKKLSINSDLKLISKKLKQIMKLEKEIKLLLKN
jgi:hypothetical protein